MLVLLRWTALANFVLVDLRSRVAARLPVACAMRARSASCERCLFWGAVAGA